MKEVSEFFDQLSELDRKHLLEIAQLAMQNVINLKLVRNKAIENVILQAGFKSTIDFVNEIKAAKIILPHPLSTHYGNFTDALLPFISAALACNYKASELIVSYLVEKQLIEQVGDKYRYRL